MSESVYAFIIWAVVGVLFIGYGIYVCFSKKQKPFSFWANAEQFPVEDVNGYNRALGKLFIFFGAVFALLGIPLLAGQNSGWIIVSMIGTMLETIIMMAIYVTVIEKKYRKK